MRPVLCGLTLAVVLAQSVPEFRFTDIAASSGLTVTNTFGGKQDQVYILEATGNGAAIFDFDGDGANDIFITNGSVLGHEGAPTPSQLYRNDGHGYFTDVAAKAGLTRSGWAQAACTGDFNNDGHEDLFVTYYGHNSLYKNTGDGKFVEVTKQAGLPDTGTRWGAGCAFVDYDRDGYLDIFVSNYVDLDLAKTPKPGGGDGCIWKGLPVSCGPKGLPLAHNVLYHNNRDGTFTDVSAQAGILAPGGRYGFGVAVADFDNDGWPDIYVACDQTPSLMYRNKHDGTFEERGDAMGVAYNVDGHLQAGMGVAVGDYDGNGMLDIVKTNFSGDRPSLYKNQNGTSFDDVSEEAGLGRNQLLGWGVALLDIDEDGWPDIVMANGHVYPNIENSPVGETYRQKTLLYRNLRNGKFADITARAGPAFGVYRPARGLATGDLDGDGRPEIVIVNMNQAPSLLKNSGARKNAVSVSLRGTKSNRSAIGARVKIVAGGHTQMQEVASGGSYFSQNSMTLYFGLGDAVKAERMEIRWPSGDSQTWTNVPGNRTVKVVEGEQGLSCVSWKAGLPACKMP